MRRKYLATLAAFVLALTGASPGIARSAPTAGAESGALVSAPAGPTDESKVPHYFGPWPNWANSPLTLPDVGVTITGDGSGATAEATIGANGAVTGLTITDPGSGYTFADVAFSGAGTGAAATAGVTTNGSVTGVTVLQGGGGYTAPTVTFTGGAAAPVTTSVGNPLVSRAYATDFAAPPTVVPASVVQVANHTVAVTAGDATGGTFVLTVDGLASAPIAFDASAATLEAALTGATVTGTGPWTIVFAAADPVVTIDGTGLTRGVTDGTATGVADTSTIDVGSATGGTFTIAVDGLTTAAIAWNASAAEVQAALLLAGVTATVSGAGSPADPWIVVFAAAPMTVVVDNTALTQEATGFAATAAGTWVASAGTAIGGAFTLTVDGLASASIAFDASAATLEAALTGATVTGTGPWTIVFASPPAGVSIDGSGLNQPTAPALVPVFVVVPTPLPVGNLLSFDAWNQATAGGSPAPSAGNDFHAYVLRPAGSDYTVVFDSGPLTVPALADPAVGEIVSYPAPNVPVQAGDVLGFYGSGIPVDTGAGTDIFSFPAPTAPVLNELVSIGSAGYPLYGQARTYSFGATVSDTSGVGSPTAATASAFGGVDVITLGDAGSGYTFPTVDIDFPDDPAGTQATAHVTCEEVDCIPATEGGTVTITGVVVDNPGSGYSTAPGVVIRNGTAFDPVPGATHATATATLAIQTVVLDTFGAGYQTAPTVTINDATGTGAMATATTDIGIVSSLTLTAGGSGYLTPGIKKFEDALPGLCMPPACPDYLLEPDGKYIPLGVAEQKVYNGVKADEFVIGLIQYKTSFSSSLPDTMVRGYVQLETADNADISQHWPVTNTLMDGTEVPVMQADGVTQWLAVTPPQWLGPTILATKDKPVRITFHNLLPTGNDGDLFLPVDSSLMGSGMGPDGPMEPMDAESVTDEVRNPMCTDAQSMGGMCFTKNRATLHLHGGITPWISDGTPHQWITPANEMADWPEGVSVGNVPDMDTCTADDPATPVDESAIDGCQTFYYTNQQSARLMFYHDHAWGITRLNVYAGEAAGYLISDDTEQALLDSGTIPADQIPLVVQDRTFVPDAVQLAYQDPTWDTERWGGMGSFWYHHVYMPAQNPGDPSGMSAYGRWMYGPWFWPPATATKYGPIPNPYHDMDPDGADDIAGNADDWLTPLATPCNIDDPATWQYDTDPFCEPAEIPGTPNISVGMEQFNDTPIVNGVAYPTVTLEPKSYRFRVLNAANDRFFNFQWYEGEASTASTGLNAAGDPIGPTEVALNAAEVAAAQTDPVMFPTPVSNAGPDWVQIGTEGGFLPAPVVVDGQQETTWITDPTRFDVGNVDQHSLLLAPAERADVIVDFSQFAGKTLILYNDAPAAFPARVPSYDYYTGAPDTGAGVVIPGYGPNTRTIMQVKIADAPAAPAFNLTKLQNAFKHNANGTGVFESGQHPIIVGQAAYNSAYGTNFAASSNCNAPGSTLTRCDGLVRINDTSTFGFNTLKSPNTKTVMKVEPKAIHDEMNSTTFDEFGRMSANLGIEAQPPTPGLQNVTLYPYVNPSTELIDGTNLPKQNVAYDANGDVVSDVKISPIASAADGTQIWRVTHNGVDTHPIHFHLYDVQVLNRVAWDNIISPTDRTELGWKDTVRMNPLQDITVALRPIIPEVPWELPNSIRPLNPMMPLGDTSMFNNKDVQGNPTTPITNALANFGWEYVYHCHILSHEEMDMMRPVILALPPLEPDGLTLAITGSGNNRRIQVTFNDNSINETAFLVQRTTNGTTWTTAGNPILSPLDQSNTHRTGVTFTDPTANANTAYLYRVVAQNTVGYPGANGQFETLTVQSMSATAGINAPLAPTNLVATLQAGPRLSLTFRDNATNETGFTVERSVNGGAFSAFQALPRRNNTGNVTFLDTTIVPGMAYEYRVFASNIAGSSAFSNVATFQVPAVPAAPSGFEATTALGNGNNRTVTLNWTDNATDETGFTVQRSTNASFAAGVTTTNVAANATTLTVTGLSRNTTYFFRIRANNGAFVSSAWVDLPSILTLP